MAKPSYVYTLARPDGLVFYVGKGRRARMNVHEQEARKGCDCPKCIVIRATWQEGQDIIKSIVFESFDEDAVLAHERAMIASIGQENLCNRTGGGEGRARSPFKDMYKRYLDDLNYSEWSEYRKVRRDYSLLRLYAKRRILLQRWYESNSALVANAKQQAIRDQRPYNARIEKSIAPPW